MKNTWKSKNRRSLNHFNQIYFWPPAACCEFFFCKKSKVFSQVQRFYNAGKISMAREWFWKPYLAAVAEEDLRWSVLPWLSHNFSLIIIALQGPACNFFLRSLAVLSISVRYYSSYYSIESAAYVLHVLYCQHEPCFQEEQQQRFAQSSENSKNSWCWRIR